MITSILQGGLGNQLFQYFHGLAAAKHAGVGLQLDVSSFQRDPQRRYSLDLFKGITEPLVTGSKATIVEESLAFRPEYLTAQDGDVFRGYWQSEDYFRSTLGPTTIFMKLRTAKEVPGEEYKEVAGKIKDAWETSTFVTIRRSDYLHKQDYHGVLPMSYYLRALGEIRHRLQQDPKVFVFSDDPEWCKANLNYAAFGKFTVVGTYDQTTPNHLGREDIDLYLMSQCWNGVMANSTFSWWGAYLGDFMQRPRTIIAPRQWFTDQKANEITIVPERWTQL